MSLANYEVLNDESSRAPSRGVSKIKISDIIIMLIIVILCSTCIIPFIHIAAKSVSSNTEVLSKNVYLFPKGFNLEAYKAIFRDGQLTHAMLYTIFCYWYFYRTWYGGYDMCSISINQKEIKRT